MCALIGVLLGAGFAAVATIVGVILEFVTD